MVAITFDPLHVPLAEAELRVGDVLLTRGRSWISRMISRRGRGPWSHAGMLIECRGQWVVAEVREWYGGRMRPLAAEVRDSAGQLDVFRFRFPTHDAQRERILRQMADFAGRPYSYGQVLAAALKHTYFLGWASPPTLQEAIDRPGAPLFCSQAVALAFEAGGFDLVPNLASRYTEPSDLARSSCLRYVCTLEK